MRHTEPLAEVVGLTYKLIEAQFHDHMQLSFQAGKLYESAVGPYLARALIYKLQVDAHLDRRDHGLSAMTNSGRYYRGYLYFPQFWMRVKWANSSISFQPDLISSSGTPRERLSSSKRTEFGTALVNGVRKRMHPEMSAPQDA